MPEQPRTAGAVFLSYASQDAEAARRICEALRASGVEVWFDADGGLEHGDEWDAKIRRQIKECVLFIPIISANTQAREEGYFRIEWELAAQRALGIASGTAFILPIVIDDTREPAALVPDRFRSVQWTKLPGGVITPEVQARFLKLWSHRAGVAAHQEAQATEAAAAPVALPSPRGAWWRPAGWALLALGVVGGAYFWLRPHGGMVPPVQPAGLPPGPSTPAAARDWPRDPELKRAVGLLDRLEAIPEDIRLAEEIVQHVMDKAPTDPETTAAMARVQSMWLLRGWDRSNDRYLKTKAIAERALQLAPDEPEALIALTIYLYTRGAEMERARSLAQRAVDLAPAEPRFHRMRDNVLFFTPGVPPAEAFASAERTVALFPRDALVRYELARHYRDAGRWTEFERETDASLALAPVANAMVWKARADFGLRGDLVAMKRQLDQVPARVRVIERTVYSYFLYAAFSGKTAEGLEALHAMPESWMIDFDYRGPKALLIAALLELAGKKELARLQYAEARSELLRGRASNPSDMQSWQNEAWILHGLGRDEEARAALRIFNESIERPYRISPISTWWFQSIAANLLLGERPTALELLREAGATADGRATLRARLGLDRRMAAFRDDPDITALLAEPKPVPTPSAAEPVAVPPVDDKSVAVLAFTNLSDDKANEYFSDGISEELLNVLAKIPGLKVTARTSSFYFKGKDTPIPEIAQQLGVAYVVEGSVRKQGDKVRITAQLIKAADGFHVWSDTFTRDLKDIFAVQDEIAGLIARNLQLKLGAGNFAGDKSTDVEAWQLYLNGRRAWNLRTPEGYREAETHFQRAIALDARFARAYAALADVWHNRAIDEGGGTFSPRWRTSLTAIKSRTLIDKALEIDPRCAEAYASLGMNLQLGWQDEPALQAYRRAIELNPNYATAHQWLGLALLGMGEMDETLSEVKQAAELDPLSHRILSDYANVLNWVGRPKEALAVSRRALAIQPSEVQAVLQEARALALLGRPLEAVALVEGTEKKGLSTRMRGEALSILVVAKQPEAILRLMGDVDAMPASTLKFAGLVALGRIDAAFADFESSPAWNGWGLVEAAFGSLYEPIRGDARFQKMIETSGRAEYFHRAQAWRAAHPSEKPAVK